MIRQVIWIARINATLPPGVPPIPPWSTSTIQALLICFLCAVGWTASAVAHFMFLRHERRIRRFVEFGPNGLIFQRPTLFRGYRQWPWSDVRDAQVTILRSIMPRYRSAWLTVTLRTGRGLRFRMMGQDQINLAEQFASQVRNLIASPSQPESRVSL